MSRFVVLAPNRWDCVWMNRQQIFSRLAQRHFVLYSNGALNIRQGHARERPRASDRVSRPGEVLVDEPPSLLRRAPRLARWDRFVLQRTAGAGAGSLARQVLVQSSHMCSIQSSGLTSSTSTPTTSCITHTIYSNVIADGARRSMPSRDS